MRHDEGIRLVISFAVHDVDRFRKMAEAMVTHSQQEPGTLVYDWYIDEATGTATLYEAYADHDAVATHGAGPVFSEIAPQYLDVLSVTAVQVFGEAGALAEGGDVLGAPTKWWGPAFTAVTD